MEHGISCLPVEFFDRRAFKAIFDLGDTTYDLTVDEVPAKAAAETTISFTNAIINRIKTAKKAA